MADKTPEEVWAEALPSSDPKTAWEQALPRSAGEAFIRSGSTALLPGAAAAAAFTPAFEAGTALAAETGPFAPLIGLGAGAIASGIAALGTSYGQRKAINVVAPEFLKREQLAAAQHPYAAMAGHIASAAPSFEFAPLQSLRGLTDIATGKFGTTAARTAATQFGTQGALTAANTLVSEGRLPAPQELEEAGATALLFGGPREYLRIPTRWTPREPTPPTPRGPLQLSEMTPSTRAELFQMRAPGEAQARAAIPQFAESHIPMQMPAPPPLKRGFQEPGRLVGQVPEGEAILERGRRVHPSVIRRSFILDRIDEIQKEWEAAEKVGDVRKQGQLQNEHLKLLHQLDDIRTAEVLTPPVERPAPAEFEGTYPPTAAQLGTFETRGAPPPELSQARPTVLEGAPGPGAEALPVPKGGTEVSEQIELVRDQLAEAQKAKKPKLVKQLQDRLDQLEEQRKLGATFPSGMQRGMPGEPERVGAVAPEALQAELPPGAPAEPTPTAPKPEGAELEFLAPRGPLEQAKRREVTNVIRQRQADAAQLEAAAKALREAAKAPEPTKGRAPELPAPKIDLRQLEAVMRRQLRGPEQRPEVTGATFTNPETGQTSVAGNHPEAAAKQGVEATGPRTSREGPEFGYEVTNPTTGQKQLVSRDTAENVARQSGQLLEEPKSPSGKVHSDEIESPTQPGKTLGETKGPEQPPLTFGFFGMIDPAAVKRTWEDLKKFREGLPEALKNWSARMPLRKVMDQGFDAADNNANILGAQMRTRVGVGTNEAQRRAASAVIAAGFDRNKLPDLLALVAGKNDEAEAAVRYAMNRWDEVLPVARKGEQVFANQLTSENAAGINTLDRDNYLPGVYEEGSTWLGPFKEFITGGGGGGVATGFKKGKVYETPFHAIADGFKPKSLDLAQLVEHRVRQGQKLINRIAWADSLKAYADPTDGKPIATKLQTVTRGPGQPAYKKAPPGYSARNVAPGMDIAVHDGYARLFDALTGTSAIANAEIAGIPIGTMALRAGAEIKHKLLFFDTFHASRIAQRQFFLTGKVSYQKGATLLEYSDADLAEAVRHNEITPEMADWAKANRGKAQLLIDAGLNVGRVQEALYNDVVNPILKLGQFKQFNRWVFDKLTRGAMLESAMIEFDRLKGATGKSDQEVAMQVSRDLNKYFGNLGRQGILKNKTLQDFARMMFLAPNWVESLLQTEAHAYKQMGQATYNGLTKGQWNIGSLGKGVGTGVVAYFLGAQLLNLATRGNFTWDNPEHGHKLDAWVPDVSGKTKGFFLSPFGTVAEMTYDAYKYRQQEPGYLAAIGRMWRNKLSPVGRAIDVLKTGQDWNGEHLSQDWDRYKAAAISLAPLPIPASPLLHGGQLGGLGAALQRQAIASAGIKTEAAGTSNSQVLALAKAWMQESEDPRVHEAWLRRVQSSYSSPYRNLRIALLRGTDDDVRNQYRQLLDNRAPDETEYKRSGTIYKALAARHPFTNTRANDQKFLESLTPAQRAIYDDANREREQSLRRFLELRSTIQPER